MAQQLDIEGGSASNQHLEFDFIRTEGHGYLKVSHDLIRRICHHAGEISKYSGMDNEYVYLEEDSDATMFLSFAQTKGYTWKIWDCYDPTFRTTHNYDASKITPFGLMLTKQPVAKQGDFFKPELF